MTVETLDEPRKAEAIAQREWKPAGKATDEELKAAGTGIRALACLDDLVITGSSHPVVKVWTVAEGKVVESRKLKDGAVGSNCIEVGEENQQLVAIAYDDGIIGLWDLRQQKQAQQLESSVASGQLAKFLPGGYRIVSAGTSGTLGFWDLRTCALDEEVEPSNAASLLKKADVDDLMPVKRRRRGDRNGGAQEALNGRKKKKNASPVFSLAVSRDGRLLGCGRGSGDLSVMQLDSREWTADVNAHQGETDRPVRALAFDPASRLLLSGGDDNHVCVFDAAAWARPDSPGETRWPQLERFAAHRNWVSAASVCPDVHQRVMLTTSYDGTAKLWDFSTHSVLRIYKEHTDAILAGAFARRGRGQFFATAGMDAQIIIYASPDA